MATERQIQANRANAAKSTGPVTPAGKRISSQNAARLPVIAGTVVLKGESKRRFDDLAAALLLQFKPRNCVETALVQTMVAARWRLLRMWGIQTAAFELEMARARQEADPAAAASGAVLAAIAFRTMADTSNALALQLRLEVAYDRQFNRALSLLLKLRATLNQPTDAWDKDLEHAETQHAGLDFPDFNDKPNSEPAPQAHSPIETTRCRRHTRRRPASNKPDSRASGAAAFDSPTSGIADLPSVTATASLGPEGQAALLALVAGSDRVPCRAATAESGPTAREAVPPQEAVSMSRLGPPPPRPAFTHRPVGHDCLPVPTAVPFLSGGVKVGVATESRGPQFGLTD